MNIIVITTLFPVFDVKNKNTKADYYLAKEWKKEGHNVVILFAEGELFHRRGTRILTDYYLYDNIPVYHISYPRFIPHYQDPLFFTQKRIIDWAEESIKNSGINNVDLFYCDFPAGNWKLISYLKNKKEFENSFFVPVFNNCDFFSKKKVVDILKKSKIIGVRSNAMKQRIKKYNINCHVFVVYSGVPKTRNEISEQKIREGKKPQKIIYAGDFITLKNVDILIHSFSLLLKKYPDLKLSLIGDGEESNKLHMLVDKLMINDSVIFFGRATRDIVFKEMLDSDIFVMVSSPESFGIVYIEAMAAGCCVVGCLDEGIDGVIRNGKNGLLVKPRDIEELTRALDGYISCNNKERITLLKQSYNDVQSFSEQSVAARVLDDIVNHYN